MAASGRNLLDGKKRQASVLGSTLTSLTLNSENDSTTSSEEESVTESETSCEEEMNANGDSDQNSEDESDEKFSGKYNGKNGTGSAKSKKEQSGKEKPKVRMKTLTIDGQLVYFCVICDKIFTKKKDKINHELAHSNKTLISCPECGKDFFHESSLAHHIRSHDGEQLHFCDFCPKMFAQSHQLKAHVLSHSNSKANEISCKICCVDFKTTSELNVHHRNYVKEEMSALWCKICKLYCCRIHDGEINFSKIHAFRCSACNELFYTLRKLKLHAKRYAHKFNQQNRTAKVMIYKSNSESDPNEEDSDVVGGKRQLVKDGGPPSKKFRPSDKDNSVKRKKSVVSETDDDFVSPKLKVDSEYSKKLGKSQRKPYCKKCNMSFKEPIDLISHKMTSHYSTQKCGYCGDDFTSSTKLKQHACKMKLLQYHSSFRSGCKAGEDKDAPDSKQFECHICAKTFSLHDQLQSHLRLHTNIKSFQCYLCQRNFVNKHYLQRHLQVHIQDGSIGKKDHKHTENGSISQDVHKDDIQSDDDFTDDRLNHNLEMKPSLKLELDKENMFSFSDNSASSFVTRESDKTDALQLSSASSRSFKISMARERRKIRRKRSFTKALFCKSLTKRRAVSEIAASTAKCVVFVDKLPEEEDALNNFVVEINGAKSEVDQETTIFVELTVAKLVSKHTSVLCSSDGIDKENKIPSLGVAMNSMNSNMFEIDIHNSEEISNTLLSNNVKVLDFEVDDFSAESISSIFDRKHANLEVIKKLKSPEIVAPSTTCASRNFEPWKYDCVTFDQSLKSVCRLEKETTSLQPLHSLHLMTAKFTQKKEKPCATIVGLTDTPENEKAAKRIRHAAQSGKTCRDIAASWKSNKALLDNPKESTLVTERHKKPNLDHSKGSLKFNNNCPLLSCAVKSVPEKSLKHEQGTYRVNQSLSSKIKTEIQTSSLQFPAVNSSAFRPCSETSQRLPPSFCERSGESSTIFSTSHSSPLVKCEYIDRHDTHGQSLLDHSCRSSSSLTLSMSSHANYSNDVKGGIFSSPSTIQSTPNSAQENKVFHFDTDNPALRDMNLMEMVCSIQTHTAATTTISKPQTENQCHVMVSSSNVVQDIKREIEWGPQTLPRTIKTELTYPPYADVHRVPSSSINSPRPYDFHNSLPPPNLNSNVNTSLNHFNAPTMLPSNNPNIFNRPPFQQQPNWPMQVQTALPPQGPNLMNNPFPLLQIPPANNGVNLNRCTYNNAVDNLILGNANPNQQYGMSNPIASGAVITNPISDLPSLHFGPPAPALFPANITPLPIPLPHPSMPPAMLPNTGVFYLPF